MLARIIHKAEKREKDKRTSNQRPAEHSTPITQVEFFQKALGIGGIAEGATISSTLATRNMLVIPTNCGLARETRRAEKKQSIMFTARYSV
jgi:hypothetical protein